MNRWLCPCLSIVVLFGADAVGCTCLPRPPVPASLDSARAVFVGQVVSWRRAKWDPDGGKSGAGYAYEFRVERSWKGVTEPRVIVVTGTGRGDCGWPFEPGKTYLVYAYGSGELEAYLCSRSTTIERAGDDLAALGPHHIEFVPVHKSPLFASILVGVPALVALVLGVVIGRRWERSRPGGKLTSS